MDFAHAVIFLCLFVTVAIARDPPAGLIRLLREYKGCEIDGQFYPAGDRFSLGSICNCYCNWDGNHGCMGCGLLDCPNGHHTPEGECCPVCDTEPPKGCNIEGKFYGAGTTFDLGSMCNCRCEEDGSHGCKGCGQHFCPHGEYTPQGECCPQCIPGPLSQVVRGLEKARRTTGGCEVEGKSYSIGIEFHTEKICNCKCTGDAEFSCTGCPLAICPNGEEIPEGKCCPECI